MATFESVENLRDDAFYNSGTLKKNKRKQKTKSLIVTTTKSEANSATVDCLSLSASCDSSTFGLRPRFSFRKFGLGRSSSKSNLIDAATAAATNSNSNSTSSIDCTSNPASPSIDPNFKCPIITYNDDGDDGDGTDDDAQLNSQIESK